jgi:hypothetical protein
MRVHPYFDPVYILTASACGMPGARRFEWGSRHSDREGLLGELTPPLPRWEGPQMSVPHPCTPASAATRLCDAWLRHVKDLCGNLRVSQRPRERWCSLRRATGRTIPKPAHSGLYPGASRGPLLRARRRHRARHPNGISPVLGPHAPSSARNATSSWRASTIRGPPPLPLRPSSRGH